MAITVMVVGVGGLVGELMGWFGGSDGPAELRRVVFPIKRRAEPAKLGIEYHYDRNAILDSRLVDGQILGLAAAGNLVLFDAESYALRAERVLSRRATCMGPVHDGHVLAGISNGCIVRVALPGLELERIEDVPGVPYWIGKRAQGGLLVGYRPDAASENVRLTDFATGRSYPLGARPVLFVDQADHLWIGSGDRVRMLDLERGVSKELDLKGGFPGVAGFVELADRQVWAFGGKLQTGSPGSFIARLAPTAKPALLHASSSAKADAAAPRTPITHVVEDVEHQRVVVVSHDGVAVVEPRDPKRFTALDAIGSGRWDEGALHSLGQAHRTARGVLLNLARGGFMEATPEYTRRHLLEGQYGVSRPAEIVRLEKGTAFFGDGGPSFYVGGAWRALPDPIMPSHELLGPGRGERERIWTALLTIPLDDQTSYVVAKAGAPRRYLGHIHGLRDTFLTGRWDGTTLTTLGREDLPIEPTDTFTTPDRRLWNVDDQGLWSFTAGHWKMVMRVSGHGTGAAVQASSRESSGARGRATVKSAIGEPLHFASSASTPFYGLPTSASSWALVRLDKNDEVGIPLIDELPVSADGRRLLLHDLVAWDKQDLFLLATDHGLCLFNVKWGTCELQRPEGLGGEVSLFMRDRSNRLWMAGPGLWMLRELKRALALHPSVPMLADTRVVAMAEAPDGRLIVGTQDRGAIFLTVADRWFDQAPGLPGTPAPWDVTRPHEPSQLDASIVVRGCRATDGKIGEAAGLLDEFARYSELAGGRVRLELETAFDGRADAVVRGPDGDQLLAEVQPILGKVGGKSGFAIWKRQGPRGAPAVQVRSCPEP